MALPVVLVRFAKKFGPTAAELLVKAIKNRGAIQSELKVIAGSKDKKDLAKNLAVLVDKKILTEDNVKNIIKACAT